MKFQISNFFIMLCLLVSLAGRTTFARAASHANSSHSFSGDISLRTVSFLESIAPNVNEQLYQGTLHLAEEGRLNENLKFIAKIEYTSDPTNKSTEERDYLDLPEANLKWRDQPFLFKIGTDIYAWGVTDGVNPVDLVNARNYFDPFHSKKMGAAGLSANITLGWFEADVVYIPKARSPMLPGSNSRWLPRANYYSSSGNLSDEYILPAKFSYGFNPLAELDHARENNLAIRLQAHLPELELALYGYDGIAPVPIISPVVSGTALQLSPIYIISVDSDVILNLQDYRQTTGGASFVKTLGSWNLKGESAWTQPHSSATKYESWTTVSILAIEKSWDMGADSNFTTILQYANSNQTSALSNGVDSLSHFFDSNFMAGGRFAWRDKDSVSFFYSYDVLRFAWLGDLSYSHRLTDEFTLSGEASLLGGPENSPLGVFSKNENLSIEAKYSF